MSIKLLVISRLCWEIVDENDILRNDCQNLIQLRRAVRKIYKGMKLKQYEIYFRYSQTKFILVHDQFSYAIFYTMDSTGILYLFLLDCDDYIPGTRKFLERLDARKLREAKIANRSKYELRIPEQDYVSDSEDEEDPSEKVPTNSEIIGYAVRNLGHVSCFNMDLLFHCNLLAALKKVSTVVLE
ncbi:hypothetical protein WA026_004977 [Henosepilachna vigintioctopunctata]|uniref:Uncharacterized protein n=1 Tax=Henosepilachna vigintioctopunctata TaxID=420089 RepID=A0AAW1UVN8_9CUCU